MPRTPPRALVPQRDRPEEYERLDQCGAPHCPRQGRPAASGARYCAACSAVLYCDERCAADDWENGSHDMLCHRLALQMRNELPTKRAATLDFAAPCLTPPYRDVQQGLKCATLKKWGVHLHPLFNRLCLCPGSKPVLRFDADEALFTTFSDAALLPVLPFSKLPLTPVASWQDYYRLRGIPDDSPIALLLTYHVTVIYILSELNMLKPAPKPVVLHLVGAEVESRKLLPLWNELSAFLPSGLDLRMCLIGPAVPKAFQRATRKFDRSEDGGGCLTLSFTRGEYHEVRRQLPAVVAKPDVIIGLNAGLASLVQYRWGASVHEFIEAGVPAIFTEYSEYSVDKSCGLLATLGYKKPIRCSVNPFLQPWRRTFKVMATPNYTNGFIFGIGWPKHDGDVEGDRLAFGELPPPEVPANAVIWKMDSLCHELATYAD